MQIPFTKAEVLKYSSLYNYPDADLATALRKAVQRGYMTRDELVEVARWKWKGGGPRRLAAENTEDDVREITRISFATSSERLRITALLALKGVHWPMASVILHFAFPDRYPIFDVRVMHTVGGSKHYTLDSWLKYAELCRTTAQKLGVTMRVLDQALWQKDKEQNPKRKRKKRAA